LTPLIVSASCAVSMARIGNLEIGAITEVAARAAQPKVVVVRQHQGYPKGFRVIVMLFVSAATTGLAFGLDPTLAGLDMIKAWKGSSDRTSLSSRRCSERPNH